MLASTMGEVTMTSAYATNVRNVPVNSDQNYTWGIVEVKTGKLRKYAEIDYFFNGNLWEKLILTMKRGGMRPSAISFYKGAEIDEMNKTVKLRGHFVRDVVADKHASLWRSFFGCDNPKFLAIGNIIKMPNIASDNDSLNFFVNGSNVNEVLLDEDAV